MQTVCKNGKQYTYPVKYRRKSAVKGRPKTIHRILHDELNTLEDHHLVAILELVRMYKKSEGLSEISKPAPVNNQQQIPELIS